MTLMHRGDAVIAEDVEDLRSWVARLEGAPQVHESVVLSCHRHGDEPATWTYVEADPAKGVARRRCLSCAGVSYLLDSDHRWSHPPMWSCKGCKQSIVEMVAGLSTPDGEHVEWVVVGARCVECGRIDGLTDAVVDSQPVAQVLEAL